MKAGMKNDEISLGFKKHRKYMYFTGLFHLIFKVWHRKEIEIKMEDGEGSEMIHSYEPSKKNMGLICEFAVTWSYELI